MPRGHLSAFAPAASRLKLNNIETGRWRTRGPLPGAGPVPPGRCGDAPAGPSERPRTSARTGKRQHGQAQRRCGHRTARSYAPIRLFHLRGWEGDPSEAARRGRPRISRAALARLRAAALSCATAPVPLVHVLESLPQQKSPRFSAGAWKHALARKLTCTLR